MITALNASHFESVQLGRCRGRRRKPSSNEERPQSARFDRQPALPPNLATEWNGQGEDQWIAENTSSAQQVPCGQELQLKLALQTCKNGPAPSAASTLLPAPDRLRQQARQSRTVESGPCRQHAALILAQPPPRRPTPNRVIFGG